MSDTNLNFSSFNSKLRKRKDISLNLCSCNTIKSVNKGVEENTVAQLRNNKAIVERAIERVRPNSRPREKYLFWNKINVIFKELVNYVESENKSKSKMKVTAVLN